MIRIRGEITLSTRDLSNDIRFFSHVLKMQMKSIWPADDPRVVVFSGHGLRVRLDAGAPEANATIRILTTDPDAFAGGARDLTAPGGTQIEIDELDPPVVMPKTDHAFIVRRLSDRAPWVIGRAGMQYRDLIPGRLGGSIIASHIRIPDGGPVPDVVHYHKVGFQLIFCYRGWVDVVYEDQGGPIRLHAGDCFIQPPEIRHRVLEASEGIEVIEIGVPADHVTEIDRKMTLPTADLRRDREWQGQRFVHNVGAKAKWHPFRIPGFTCRDTTISENTRGVASVQVVRQNGEDAKWTSHDTDILFTFVMAGGMTLEARDRPSHILEPGDAFVIPPDLPVLYADATDDLELLEVALPGQFRTAVL